MDGNSYSWWAFRIFLIFSARGTRRQEGAWDGFSLKIPGGGGAPRERGGGEGRGCLWGKWDGGGAKFLLGGQNSHQVLDP